MKLALDYDNTYTRDPELWNAFIANAKSRGHEVVCVTMRHGREEQVEIPCPVIYTARQAKMKHLDDRGVKIDIWIDDSPHWIFQDG